MAKIVVIGSANMDTTHQLKGDFPEIFTSESVNEIESTARVLGGKGFNQARAIKLQNPEAEVAFIGCIGDDESAAKVREEMERVGLNHSGVRNLENHTTDGRVILVNNKGENNMFGYGDCVKQLTPEMIDLDLLSEADIVAIQMKMPAETVKFVIEYCAEHGKQLVIDPTPQEKSGILVEDMAELLKKATYLTPNEEEAFALIGYMQGKELSQIKEEFKNTPRDIRLKMIESLVKKCPNIIATVGDKGVIFNEDGRIRKQKPYETQCIDSTGAGDTFNGGLVGALARGAKLREAVKYAVMASSMKVKHRGAQNGVPTGEQTREAIEVYEQEHEVDIDEE